MKKVISYARTNQPDAGRIETQQQKIREYVSKIDGAEIVWEISEYCSGSHIGEKLREISSESFDTLIVTGYSRICRNSMELYEFMQEFGHEIISLEGK